ncbi:hypothetical protein [Micromonospora sp. NPDC049274]|uniref:hypothetical protein n=1 Tax=Micromonospora sp. NPDC049274 TaxID=3154829 RepID=UPI003445F060
MPAKEIKIDEAFIRNITSILNVVRNETSSVRNGSNPHDGGHPHGLPLNAIQVAAGAPGFAAGAALKARVGALGQQLDSKINAVDQKLASLAQALQHVLDDANDTERDNLSLADLDKYLTVPSTR